MQNLGHIEPLWDIEEFKTLQYKFDTHKDSDLLEIYHSSGHDMDAMTLYNYFEPGPMPSTMENYIKPKFSFLDNLAIAVNLFRPGQYLPYHRDLYQKYRQHHSVEDRPIMRCILMLEDGVPGQILEINRRVYSCWSSGDWFSWINDENHAFYNFSTKNRYAVQITGTLKQ
jgi:hypothetical protein